MLIRKGYTMKRFFTILISISLILLVSALSACAPEGGDSSTSGSQQTGNSYTVTFDSRGGSEVSAQILKKGEKATQPSAPIREGGEFVKYNFSGWYLNGNPYDFDSAVSSDITLVAVWEEVVWSQDIENRD